jgi:hypothetical protein
VLFNFIPLTVSRLLTSEVCHTFQNIHVQLFWTVRHSGKISDKCHGFSLQHSMRNTSLSVHLRYATGMNIRSLARQFARRSGLRYVLKKILKIIDLSTRQYQSPDCLTDFAQIRYGRRTLNFVHPFYVILKAICLRAFIIFYIIF